ncbi:MAG: AAA family ATPase [Actinomycetota bacterium]|nr:AAA family ATPase [Actinomycetota bacterium]
MVHPFLEDLERRGLYESERPLKPVGVLNLPKAAPGDEDATRYALAALESECQKVAEAPEGVRNNTLNTAAFNLGQLVAGGYLDGAEVTAQLTNAAAIAGLDMREIDATVPHAISDGEKIPRTVQLQPRVEHADNTTFTPTTVADGASEDTAAEGEPHPFSHGVNGEQFIFRVQAEEPAIWGKDHHVLWAPGEALMVTGPPGVGKTTTVQQLVLARLGLVDTFLGFPVEKTASKVLYLAMDRPRQIARSMRRMVDDGDRDLLAERLVVWQGPLIADVAKSPNIFLAMAEHYGADTIVVDSVKDAALGLGDSERAGMYNRARQRALAGNIEVVEISHQVKRGTNGTAPKTLADVHGGMELTAGAGSVFLVWGQAGDPVVEFRHLKQPSDVVGPLLLVHNHDAGRTHVEEQPDAGDILRLEPWKVWSVVDLAGVTKDGDGKPTRGEIERVRRKVERLADEGHVLRIPGETTARGGRPEVRYRWAAAAADTSWEAS